MSCIVCIQPQHGAQNMAKIFICNVFLIFLSQSHRRHVRTYAYHNTNLGSRPYIIALICLQNILHVCMMHGKHPNNAPFCVPKWLCMGTMDTFLQFMPIHICIMNLPLQFLDVNQHR